MSVVAPLQAGGRGPFGWLWSEGVSWDGPALEERVATRARELMVDGVGPGATVFVVAEPDAATIVELLALWHVGAVPVPLNARLTEAEQNDARRRLTGARFPFGTQVVLWTSGTSGRPRGVALSWKNLVASADAAAQRLDLGPDDVWVASLSPAHVGGLALITRAFILGGSLVLPREPGIAGLSSVLDGGGGPQEGDASNARPATDRSPKPTDRSPKPTHHSPKPTHLSLVPTQLLRLLDHRGDKGPPDTLRCVLVGGAHAPERLVRRALAQGWPIALTYGATEMSSQIATAPPALTRMLPGTVGPPLAGVEVRIGEDGELRTRGPSMALGCVGQGREGGAGEAGGGSRGEGGPGQTPLVDAEGWYRTGDLGRIDEDGNLWITGRRIDRIVSGGVTVDAVEVEEALRAHPTVVDACVVGIPDEEWGERVGAWVEAVVGEFELEELERHLRERLAAAKLPRSWRTEGTLPRNANGKVDRGAVREALTR